MQVSRTNWYEAGGLGTIAIAVFLLWGTPVIYPLKILVVFFHELSHALMAIVTGGRVVQIEVNALQGGLCITQGGSRFLTLSAGYLGSLVLGGVILLYGARRRGHGKVTAALGAVLLGVTFIWVRPIIGFGFLFGFGVGLVLMIVGLNLSREFNRFLLKVIGLTSCMYAVLDIGSDVLARPGAVSDATMLAEVTGIPSVLWGLIWVAIALPLSAFFVMSACQRPETIPSPRR